MASKKNKGHRLQIVSYCIVIAAFIISIAFPLLLQFVEPFAAPTAVYSEMIVKGGHLSQGGSLLSYPQGFWGSALNTEIQYPIGSILVSVFMLITGLPVQYAMFISLTAVGNLIYFVIAKYVLSSVTSNKGFVWLFSSLSYLFFSVLSPADGAVGRASLGIMFLAFFIYVYMRFLRPKFPISRMRFLGSMVLLILLVLTIGFQYYFATIDIIALMILIIVTMTFSKNTLPWKRRWPEWSILVIAIFLFLGTTTMASQIQSASVSQMFSSFVQFIGSMIGKLGINVDWLTVQSLSWNINLATFDSLTSFGNHVLFLTQFSSIIAIMACVLAYRPRKLERSPKDVVWLFCVFILFLSVGELGYLTVGPYSPFRLLVWFGPIVILSIILGAISKRNNDRKVKFAKLKIAIALLVISIFCISIWGGIQIATTYGVSGAKPFAYDNVFSLSYFLCTHTTNERPLVLTGDEGYVANVFFISSLFNKTRSVVAEPLLSDSVTLNDAIESGNANAFISAMKSRQISYLLIVDNGKPIYGDVWGYIINNPKADKISQLHFDRIYDDGQTNLFQLFGESKPYYELK